MWFQLTKISGKSSLADQGRSPQTRGPHLFWEYIKSLSVNPLQGRRRESRIQGGEECHVKDVDALPAHASRFLCALGKQLFGLAGRFFLEVGLIDKMVEPYSCNWINVFPALTSKIAVNTLKSQTYVWSGAPKWAYTLNFYLCEPAPNIPQSLHREDTFINVSKELKY